MATSRPILVSAMAAGSSDCDSISGRAAVPPCMERSSHVEITGPEIVETPSVHSAELRDEEPSEELRSVLGILRRPQTERERASVADAALPMLDTVAARGVRLSRRGRLQVVPGSSSGEPKIIVLEHARDQYGSVGAATPRTLRQPTLPHHASGGCVTEVVPDGVAIVEATLADGRIIAEAVVDNLVQLDAGDDALDPFPIVIRWLGSAGQEIQRVDAG